MRMVSQGKLPLAQGKGLLGTEDFCGHSPRVGHPFRSAAVPACLKAMAWASSVHWH